MRVAVVGASGTGSIMCLFGDAQLSRTKSRPDSAAMSSSRMGEGFESLAERAVPKGKKAVKTAVAVRLRILRMEKLNTATLTQKRP